MSAENLEFMTQVWSCSLGGDAPLQLDGWLSDDEISHLSALKLPLTAKRFALGRILAKLGIAQLDGGEPKQIQIVTDSLGKPHVAGDGPAISIAHRDHMVIVAVSRAQSIGVDIETMTGAFDVGQLVPIACNPDEAAWVRAPDGGELERLLRLWTLKEAALKCLGQGLRRDPREIAFLCPLGAEPRLGGDPEDMRFAGLDLGQGWLGALAVRGGAPDFQLHDGAALLAAL